MLNASQLPEEVRRANFQLPSAYYRIFELGLTNVSPWRFIEDAEEFSGVYEALRELYPEHILLPFARRADNDDVACIVVESPQYAGNRIVIVHLFASPDDAIDAVYETFWDWFRTAVDEMIELNS